MKTKIKCNHCGSNRIYKLSYFQNIATCKTCKKEQDIKFDDEKFNQKIQTAQFY